MPLSHITSFDCCLGEGSAAPQMQALCTVLATDSACFLLAVRDFRLVFTSKESEILFRPCLTRLKPSITSLPALLPLKPL